MEKFGCIFLEVLMLSTNLLYFIKVCSTPITTLKLVNIIIFFDQFNFIQFTFLFTVDAIRIDLPRTFPENVFFENIRTPLFNVLVAYANHNKDVGYCQGLNYIAGRCSINFNCCLLLKC